MSYARSARSGAATASPSRTHLRPAIETARRAIETNRTAEFLDEIDATISSRVLRAALFSAARDVAGANEAVSPAEGTILAEVAVRFG